MHSPDFWLWPDAPSSQMSEHQVDDPWVMLFHPRFQWEVGPAPILTVIPSLFQDLTTSVDHHQSCSSTTVHQRLWTLIPRCLSSTIGLFRSSNAPTDYRLFSFLSSIISPTDDCRATSTNSFFCFCFFQRQPGDGSKLGLIVGASTRTTSRFWRGIVQITSRTDPREAVKAVVSIGIELATVDSRATSTNPT
ncbi:hypothetical protein PGT21_018811 [Puccinia graminis f. sp. tritici]|uniref:Uncharacterized protein n=1 Tax=Puccinia graminis f. sp. tritici TaxID=56615 RepID=A0A5B0M3N1_PUCGR|nr:hypothetical protein PGT21_018811 [Puccinia graminis f. sp. tritici]